MFYGFTQFLPCIFTNLENIYGDIGARRAGLPARYRGRGGAGVALERPGPPHQMRLCWRSGHLDNLGLAHPFINFLKLQFDYHIPVFFLQG